MMHHEQPVCVRVTATEITASSPCFALKLTPPPPRRRQHTTGERPSILKTPSPTPLITSYQNVLSALPTPPPRAKKEAARASPIQVATPFDSPPTSPDVSLDTWTTPELSFDVSSSPDVSVDIKTSKLSFDVFNSPDVSVDVVKLSSDVTSSSDVSVDNVKKPKLSFDVSSSPDVSIDNVQTPDVTHTFHAVPCFVVLDSENASEVNSVPEPARSPAPSVSPSSRKPPLPPVRPQPHSAKLTTGVKGRIASARRQYLDAQTASLQQKSAGSQVILQDRFQRFCAQTEAERIRLAASVPDLPLEQMRRSPSPTCAQIDRPDASQKEGTSPSLSSSSSSYRVKHPPVRPWPLPPTLAPISKSLGVLETDLDSEDPCTIEVTNLDAFLSRTNSLMALRESRPAPDDRTRSMDFLLDGDNRATAAAPENALTAKVKSEHELRIERSLNNLHLPEWYKRRPREGFLLGQTRNQERPPSQHLRWTGLGSRTPSNCSLVPPGNTVPPKRPDWRYVNSLRSSRESLQSSTASPDSTSSTPFFSWTAYKAGRTQPYLGWRQAASIGSSAVPSPASSTPLSGSRPVSPGRWWQPNHNQNNTPQPEQNDLKAEPAGIRNTMTRDRYSYIQSIYNGDTPKFTNTTCPVKPPRRTTAEEQRQEDAGVDDQVQEEKVSGGVFWMESSFVGSRSTTSVVVLPDEQEEDRVSVVEVQQPQQQDSVRNGERPPHVHQQPFPQSKRGSKGHCGGELTRSSTSERLGRFRCKVQ